MLTRRTFSLSLAGASLLPAQEDFSGELDRYLTGLAEQQWTARKAKIAALRSPADVRARQSFIRKWVADANGGVATPKTPLNPRVTGTLERDGYRVEKLVYESLPNFYVTANVYVPASGTGPFPAVLGVAGHSDTGKAIATYQHVWISLAKRGYVVLAFDPAGQGERLQYVDPATGKSKVGVGTREHTMAGLQCLLTGTTYARYEMIDGIRGFDYLLTRKDVDPKRIAVAGNSGGGTQAAYLAVVEPRLAAAVASCYITSWDTMWNTPGPQDAEQIFPGFLEAGLDFGDFLIAFAPKPIMMTTAIKDFFPIAGARATFAEVEKVFASADAPGRAGYFEFDDPHGWSQPRREACYRWFAKWLQSREEDGAEPPHTPEPAENLNVTPTGQLATSFGGETVWSINVKLAEQLHSRRTALRASPSELRQAIRSRLKMTKPAGAVQATGADSALRIVTEPGIRVPAVLTGANAGQRRPAVIWIDEAGMAAAPVSTAGTRTPGSVMIRRAESAPLA